jgi:hypothetical protein
MTRLVLYVAHPLGAPDRAGLDANLARAMRWLSWLRRAFPDTTFVAPWIAAVAAGEDDADPRQREAGLVDADAVIPRLDGVVLVGGRVSSGMARERGRARRAWDLTSLGDEPPATRPIVRFAIWAGCFERGACDRSAESSAVPVPVDEIEAAKHRLRTGPFAARYPEDAAPPPETVNDGALEHTTDQAPAAPTTTEAPTP